MLQQAIDHPFVGLVILVAFGFLIFATYLGMSCLPVARRSFLGGKRRKFAKPSGPLFDGLVAFAIFMVSIPATILILFAIGEMAGLVNMVPDPAATGDERARLRNWLELCYFSASVIVAGVAWFAVQFAKKQAIEAEHSRAAQVYLELTGRYTSERLTRSRLMVVSLWHEFHSDREAEMTVGEFVHRRIAALRSSNIDELEIYNKYLDLLTFFEDVGVLVKRGYVKVEDVQLLFKAAIVGVRELFEPHILARQKEDRDAQLFENFLELCAKMQA